MRGEDRLVLHLPRIRNCRSASPGGTVAQIEKRQHESAKTARWRMKARGRQRQVGGPVRPKRPREAFPGARRCQRQRPNNDAGYREVILDPDPVAVLTAYKARRVARRLAAGTDWPDTGLFFVRPDGHTWHPNAVAQRSRRMVDRAGLAPIRLHDLRYGAATLAFAAGVDIKVVSDQLGHSTTTLTRDTYQSVVKRLHREAADAVAGRIATKRRRTAWVPPSLIFKLCVAGPQPCRRHPGDRPPTPEP
jgi:hypothetical protein